MTRTRQFLCLTAFGLLAARAVADADAYRLFKHQSNEEIPGKFTFVRVEYASTGGWGEAWYQYDGRVWNRWETDYPEADENFVFRLSELTTLSPNPRAITTQLTSEQIYDYPFLYMCDVGWMQLTREEKQALRDYLLRGGFVWVDDFWGYDEWDNLEEQMKGVLPEYQWRDIPKDHPILSIVYKLDGCPQIPARDFAVQGMKHDPAWIHRNDRRFGGVEEVHFRGWFDDKDRLMLLCTHNTDVGDGWEREAEDESYFQEYSTRAYALGINIIYYALTH